MKINGLKHKAWISIYMEAQDSFPTKQKPCEAWLNMIELKIETFHISSKSNPNLLIYKDLIQFSWPNSFTYIYTTIPDPVDTKSLPQKP